MAILFDGTVPAVSPWYLNQSASRGRTTTVPDPAYPNKTCTHFLALDSDVAPLTPTINPRAQLVSPLDLFTEGEDVWESFEVYIPSTFPVLKTGWVGLQTPIYGSPFSESPPMGISIDHGDFRFQRNGLAPVPWEITWNAPAVAESWTRFTWHFLPSKTAGWVELYVHGKQVPLLEKGVTYERLPLVTIDASCSKGPWFADQQLYYQAGIAPQLEMYFRGLKIATSKAEAES